MVPILVRRYQVLRPDLCGHGRSRSPKLVEYDIASMANDILGLCGQLAWTRFAGCGVSIGGMTALQMAAPAPDRITAQVDLQCPARMQERSGGWQERALAVLA